MDVSKFNFADKWQPKVGTVRPRISVYFARTRVKCKVPARDGEGKKIRDEKGKTVFEDGYRLTHRLTFSKQLAEKFLVGADEVILGFDAESGTMTVIRTDMPGLEVADTTKTFKVVRTDIETKVSALWAFKQWGFNLPTLDTYGERKNKSVAVDIPEDWDGMSIVIKVPDVLLPSKTEEVTDEEEEEIEE